MINSKFDLINLPFNPIFSVRNRSNEQTIGAASESKNALSIDSMRMYFAMTGKVNASMCLYPRLTKGVKLAFCSIALAVLGVVSPTLQAVERLQLATQNWPPYQTVNDGKMSGIAVQRVKCTLRKMGQPYQLRMMRWDKAQLLVETNEMDGFFSGSANAPRAKYAVPSDPLISIGRFWFIAPGTSLDFERQSSKFEARYGAKFNTSKWLFLKKNGYNVVKKPRDADALLQMLWRRQIDVALEYGRVFEHSMEKMGIPLDYFKRIEVSKQNLSVHFSKAFLKLNPNFLAAFNQSLASCKRETS